VPESALQRDRRNPLGRRAARQSAARFCESSRRDEFVGRLAARCDLALQQSRFDTYDEALDAAADARALVVGSTEHGTVRPQRVGPAARRYRFTGLQRHKQGRVGHGATERLVQPACRSPDHDPAGDNRMDSV
jgi:hypothetical protein